MIDIANERKFNPATVVSRKFVTLLFARCLSRERTTTRMGRNIGMRTSPRLKMALRGLSPGAGQNVWTFGNHGDGRARSERRGQRLDGSVGGRVRLPP